MRYRDLDGWNGARASVEYLWPWVPKTTWDRVGDAEAPAWLHHLAGSGEVMCAAWELGLVKARPRQ